MKSSALVSVKSANVYQVSVNGELAVVTGA